MAFRLRAKQDRLAAFSRAIAIGVGFLIAGCNQRPLPESDTYAGQQLTIFDNRGICQHSGFCTDRLAAVFRTDTEPFVARYGAKAVTV